MVPLTFRCLLREHPVISFGSCVLAESDDNDSHSFVLSSLFPWEFKSGQPLLQTTTCSPFRRRDMGGVLVVDHDQETRDVW